MSVLPDANILSACKALFGHDASITSSFLLSLKQNTLKTAFRKKAKETHPDLFTAHDHRVQRRQAEMFRVVNSAYELMRRYCERRDRARLHAHRRASDPASRARPAATRSFRMDEHGWLYQGVVPERRLEIGRYLYYRGRIPYHALLRALSWQMRQRPSIGAIARRWGWLQDADVRAIVGLRGEPRLFGHRALQLGLLTSYQARILLAYQRTLQKKLGQYFVDHGHLTRQEIEHLAGDLLRHNACYPSAPVADWRAS